MTSYVWIETDCYMIYSNSYNDSKKITFKSDKIASFDLDDTIIKTKSGKTFSQSADDWMFYDNIEDKLKSLTQNQYTIIIISNQKGIKSGKTKKTDWKGKIEEMRNRLNIDFILMCSLNDDLYRKPRTKLWDEFVKLNIPSIHPDSFYCGDAGGLKDDFADTDFKFALNIGIKFIHRDEYILGNKNLNCIAKYPIDFKKLNDNNKNNNNKFIEGKDVEVIINVGLPGSGKSTFTKNCILIKGYEYINQDELKTQQKCLKKLEEFLKQNKSVVIDNTNVSKVVRKKYLDIIKKYNVKCRCIKFNTSVEICQHNSYYRNFISEGTVKVIPQLVFNIMKKKMNEPGLDEGFYKIETVEFVPMNTMNIKNKEIYEKYYF